MLYDYEKQQNKKRKRKREEAKFGNDGMTTGNWRLHEENYLIYVAVLLHSITWEDAWI